MNYQIFVSSSGTKEIGGVALKSYSSWTFSCTVTIFGLKHHKGKRSYFI